MRLPDSGRVLSLIEESALAEIVPRFRNLAEGDVREKSPGELVTAADEAMERRLAGGLLALLPGSVVVGEESASADPARLDLLSGEAPAWVIDPLDGTANFAAGRAAFGVMVCLVFRGETAAAWIHQPMAGVSAVAERGSGSWIGGRRIRIGERREPLRAAIHGRFFPPEIRDRVDVIRSRFAEREPSHCAATTYVDLVTGELDVAMYYRLLPWDHAPGVLLHAEAGGYSTTLSGRPYSIAAHTGGLLLAPSEDVWRGMSTVLARAD